MNYVQPKVFDITKHRPAVLLVGNGLNRCMGDTNTWLNAILRLTKDDGVLDSDKDMNYSIRATVTTDENASDRWKKYAELFGREFKYIDNQLLKNLLQIPFAAILTTNYTYELENAIDSSYIQSNDKENYACTTVANHIPNNEQPDKIRLLNTFNRIPNDSHDMDIWHIHGEVREPSSMILTHEEYGRLVYELVAHEREKQESNIIRFESWIDYFLYGDLYVLGQGINFAEFDLWWLLSRRHREKNRSGKAIFYSPQEKGKVFTKIEDALDQIGMRIDHCGIELSDSKSVTNNDYFGFYEKAIERITKQVLSPLPPETEKLLDYKAYFLKANSRINHIRLICQLYKSDVYVPAYYSPIYVQGYRHLRSVIPYQYKLNNGTNAIFIYSDKESFKEKLEENDELRKMSGAEAFQLIMKYSKVSAFCLDFNSNEIWTEKNQLEFVLNNIEKIDKFFAEADERDRQRRRKNARKASEATHYVQSFIANCSFASTLEEFQQDINYWGYFNYECIFREEEFSWTSPKWAKLGDIVFFYHTKKALINISGIQRQLKSRQGNMPQDQYETLEHEIKRARENFEKYGARIFAIGQVCENFEETSSDDPFGIEKNELDHWESRHFVCMSNICVLDNPISLDEFSDFITLSPGGSYTMISGDQFEKLRELILNRNKNQETIPYYFKKSLAASQNLANITDNNWMMINNEIRSEFCSKSQFQNFYTNYLLRAIGDTKKYWQRCLYKNSETGNEAYMDNVIVYNKLYLPVKIRFNSSGRIDYVEKYCSASEILIEKDRKIDFRQVYPGKVLIIDRENISLYDSASKEINILMLLDKLKTIEDVAILKKKLADALSSSEIIDVSANKHSSGIEERSDNDRRIISEGDDQNNQPNNQGFPAQLDEYISGTVADAYQGSVYVPANYPSTSIGWAEYCLPSKKAEIAERAVFIVEGEKVIQRDKLMEKLRNSFGVKNSEKVAEATEKALKAAKIKTTKVKGIPYCWASAIEPKTFTDFRYHEEIKRRDDELPLPEIRNAVVRTLMDNGPLDENDLLVQTARTFGYQRLGPNLRNRLAEGIAYAVSDKLIRLNKQKTYELREG